MIERIVGLLQGLGWSIDGDVSSAVRIVRISTDLTVIAELSLSCTDDQAVELCRKLSELAVVTDFRGAQKTDTGWRITLGV